MRLNFHVRCEQSRGELSLSKKKLNAKAVITALILIAIFLCAYCFARDKKDFNHLSNNNPLPESERENNEDSFSNTDGHMDAVPVHWEKWMDGYHSISPQDSLFEITFMEAYFDEYERKNWKIDHKAYMSASGEIIDVPGMEGGFYTQEVTWTQNGYLYPTQKEGLVGYVNSSGDWVIEPSYSYAGPFSKGYACVRMDDPGDDGSEPQFAYIDPFGTSVIEWTYPEVVGPINEGKAVRYRITDEETASIDILDADGNMLLSGIRIDIDRMFLSSNFDEKNNCWYYLDQHFFKQGLLLASLDGKYGYLNEKGDWVIEPQYEYALPFTEGLAVVARDGFYGYIDPTGEIVIPMIYTAAWPFSEGKAAVQTDATTMEMQFIYKDGSTAFQGGYYGDLVYTAPNCIPYVFLEGLCLIHREDGWNYINSAGEPAWDDQVSVIETEQLHNQKYWATHFHNGLAEVRCANESWIINKEGKVVYRRSWGHTDTT